MLASTSSPRGSAVASAAAHQPSPLCLPLSLGVPCQHCVTDPETTVLWEGILPSLGYAAQGGCRIRGGVCQERCRACRAGGPQHYVALAFYLNGDGEATWTLHGGFSGHWGTAVEICVPGLPGPCAGAHSPTGAEALFSPKKAGAQVEQLAWAPGSSCVLGSRNTRLPKSSVLGCRLGAAARARRAELGRRPGRDENLS